MDIGAKVFCSMMCERLFKIIKLHGCATQFGSSPGVGFQDGCFSIKGALHTRHKHNLPTYVAFVDLVNIFDTVSHIMMLKILERYGTPPKLCFAISWMYDELKILLKIGEAKSEMGQKVGVRQGDCMAPVLFLFVIVVFEETLEISWKKLGHKMITFNTCTNSPRDRSSLTGHAPETFSKGTHIDIFNVLYVNDGAFPFEDRYQLAKGVQLIYDHFKLFGLEMHIGIGAKPSKTDCVFFPPQVFLKRKQTLPAMENGVI